MSLRFGTDGVRGVANSELTPELAVSLGRAAVRAIGSGRWVVGRDTRRSGPLLAAALSAGLASEGASVVDVGVLPTPGVAHLSKVDGVERYATAWPDWSITTVIDTRDVWETVWQAVSCHESQIAGYQALNAREIEDEYDVVIVHDP